MAKTNITLKIDTDLLKKVKILAAQRETSISALITAFVGRETREGYGSRAGETESARAA
jgi:hypothetical protein